MSIEESETIRGLKTRRRELQEKIDDLLFDLSEMDKVKQLLTESIQKKCRHTKIEKAGELDNSDYYNPNKRTPREYTCLHCELIAIDGRDDGAYAGVFDMLERKWHIMNNRELMRAR